MERLSQACAVGRVAFHGTGANPGWFGDLLPLLMSGLSVRIDQIAVQEISNFQYYCSPEIMFEMMNFGRTPEEFALRSERHPTWLDGLFTEAVQMVADGIDALVHQETVWRMHHDAAPDWPQGDWSIRITGEPEMQLTLAHSWNRDVLGSTAVDAIPYVVAAGPGVKTFLDLPLISGGQSAWRG